MAYISEIEAAIRAIIDVGTFQNLCNEILDREIHAPRTSLGSQSGTNKTTTGTPDTYYFDGDSYIFVEYTTTENESTRLFNKIDKDLDKCLDESKTNIPIKKIKKIIYCHTSSNLSPDYTNKLTQKCTNTGTELEIWGINELSRKIKNNYPYLAEEYLNLNIGNGQINDLNSFIEKYNCNETVASLKTEFMFREDELNAITKSINENKITVLTGQPGVGKTRLAVEVLSNLSSYNILCIRNNYSEFGNDFTRYINIHGQNLIFVDDANTFDNRLLTILDLLNNPNDNTRIIMTVRESFVSEVENKCYSFSEPNTLVIKKFSDAEIEEFLKKVFNINNPDYIKQIQRICEGNARLAYFAAKMALDKDGYQKIRNAEQLFERYYDNYLGQSSIFNDKTIITAGIISVSGMLDKNDLYNYNCIFQLCKITEEEFLENCKILNEKEILSDLNGHVSIDEQCMNNYFVYLFLYKKKFFSLDVFIKNCFDLFYERVVTSISNILSVFYSEELMNNLTEAVKTVWASFIGKDSEERFIRAFCNVAPENTLVYLYDKIEEATSRFIDIREIDLKNKNIHISDPIIEIIGGLSKTDKISESIELLCTYIEKRNDRFNEAVTVIKSYYSIDKESFRYSYNRENTIIDTILNKSKNDVLKLFFIEICNVFLSLISESRENGRHQTIVFSRVSVKSTDESRAFRKKIWDKLIEFAQKSFSVQRLFNILEVYSSGWDNNYDKELLKFDAAFIKVLLETLYSENEIKTICLLYKLNTKLRHFNLPGIKLNIENNKFLIDVVETFQEFRGNSDERQQCVKNFIDRNPIIDVNLLVRFINICNEGSGNNQVNYNFERLLTMIDNNTFYDIIKTIISSGNNINIHPGICLSRLWTFVSKEEICRLISNVSSKKQNEWQFFYFATMPNIYVTKDVYKSFIQYLEKDDDKEIKASYYRDLDFIKKYKQFDENCFIKVYSIIKDKYRYNPHIFSIYVDRLFCNDYQPAELCTVFENDLNLLFDLYIFTINKDCNFDYEGKYFIYFLNNDELFRKKYENLIFEQITSDSYIDSLPDVSKFIINSDYFEAIMDSLFNRLSKCSIFSYQIEKLGLLFSLNFTKTREYVYHLIDTNYQEKKIIQNLFVTLLDFDWNIKFDFVTYLLNKTYDFELFSSLDFRGDLGVTTTGGYVSQYESELLFWEKLIAAIPCGMNYIKHRQFCSNKIQIMKKTIENEKVREKYTKRLFFNE